MLVINIGQHLSGNKSPKRNSVSKAKFASQKLKHDAGRSVTHNRGAKGRLDRTQFCQRTNKNIDSLAINQTPYEEEVMLPAGPLNFAFKNHVIVWVIYNQTGLR